MTGRPRTTVATATRCEGVAVVLCIDQIEVVEGSEQLVSRTRVAHEVPAEALRTIVRHLWPDRNITIYDATDLH